MKELDGRVPTAAGSRPSDQAPTGLDAPRVDPSRVLTRMREYKKRADDLGFHPYMWHVSESVAMQLAIDGDRLAVLLNMPVAIHDEWAWGWMMRVLPSRYSPEHQARFWSPPRDRDASLAEDAKRLSPEGVAARPEGIAHPQPVGSETATDAAKREGEA